MMEWYPLVVQWEKYVKKKKKKEKKRQHGQSQKDVVDGIDSHSSLLSEY